MRYQSDGTDPAAEPPAHERPPKVVVGGGIGGLGVALALARAGHRVVLLERDPLTGDELGPAAAFDQPRAGTPQARHTHGLLARLTRVLRERFPDVLADLQREGAHAVPLWDDDARPNDERPHDGDVDDDAILLVRRTTLDLVLRRALRAEPGIELRGGVAVAGLLADRSGPVPVVTGVALTDGTTIDAEAVIAGTGRRGDVPGWLAGIGVTVPETEHDTHLLYLTRWYRTASELPPTMDPKMAGDAGAVKFLAVPADDRTFSVTIACDARDRDLRSQLLDPGAFDHAARLLPFGSLFDELGLTPISGVEPMGGLVNRLRRFVADDGTPLVLGFHAVGDAHTCTNPFYGRGCSLAMVQAALLADAFAAHPDDPVERSTAYEAASKVDVEPWYLHALQLDGLFGRSDVEDPRAAEDRRAAARGIDALMAASATDPVLGRRMMQVFNLLLRPDQLMADPAFLERAAAVFADPDAHPRPKIDGPTRDELLAFRAA